MHTYDEHWILAWVLKLWLNPSTNKEQGNIKKRPSPSSFPLLMSHWATWDDDGRFNLAHRDHCTNWGSCAMGVTAFFLVLHVLLWEAKVWSDCSAEKNSIAISNLDLQFLFVALWKQYLLGLLVSCLLFFFRIRVENLVWFFFND